MTVAELALRKITDYYEDEERSIMAKVTIEKELVPELCEANGDVQIPVDWCVHSRISGAPILK